MAGVILALIAVLVALFVVLPLVGLALWAFLSTVAVGLIIGALGRLVIPGSQPIGFVRTVLAGLCGSIVGGFLGDHVFHLFWGSTVLIEIAVAALVVMVLAAGSRRAVPRGY